MVFEHLYDTQFLRSHRYVVFLITLTSSIIGIFMSIVFFREASFVSLSFIGLILLETLGRLIDIQLPSKIKDEVLLAEEEFKDNIILWSYIFAGVFLPFAFYSMMSTDLFAGQAQLIHTQSITQIFSADFATILINNIGVLLLCFITAFLFGLGGIYLFIIIWNASVVGVVFGTVAATTSSPLLAFAGVLLVALPHMILEFAGYFMAGVAGERFSDWLFYKKLNKKRLENEILINFMALVIGMFLLTLAAFIESTLPMALLNIL